MQVVAGEEEKLVIIVTVGVGVAAANLAKKKEKMKRRSHKCRSVCARKDAALNRNRRPGRVWRSWKCHKSDHSV